MPSTTEERLPRPGGRVRSGTLVRTDGGAFPLRHMGREATVMVRVHGPDCDACRRYLEAVDARGEELRGWYGRLAAVLPAEHPDRRGAERLGDALEHLAVLLDPDGEGPLAHAGRPSLVVFDRFAQVYFAQAVAEEHDFIPVEEVREWLKYLATQCPECGVLDQP